MVLHLYQWERRPWLRIVRLNDAQWAMLLLSGTAPNIRYTRVCHCPKIDDRACQNCFGERIFRIANDSKELQEVIK